MREPANAHRVTLRRRGRLAVLAIAAGLLLGVGSQACLILLWSGNPGPRMLNASMVTPTASREPLDLLAGTTIPPAGATQDPQPEVSIGPEASRSPERGPVEPDGGQQPEEARGASEEPMNVLVLGVDKRPPGSKEQQIEGFRSDTMIVVQVVPSTGQIRMLSIPRDLLVEIWPGFQDRINTAYAYGGVEQAEAVVEGLTDIPIDHYAIVDFEGFEAVVDAMGGVEVDVEDEFPSRWKMGEGLQNLDGRHALLYARYRGTACGDLDRIERQQEVVAALRSKALRWNSVTKLPRIVGVLMRNVDTDVGPVDAMSLGRALVLGGGHGRIYTAQLRGTPTTLPNGDQVLLPDYAANEALLRDFRE